MDLDEHHQRCILRGSWQLASVFHFLNVFRPVLHFNLKFSMEELESALMVPDDLLSDIHIGLLKAIPPSVKNPINRETWIAALCKKLKEWWHAVAEGPFPLVLQHGDEIATYKHLSPDVRVVILKALCEARLDQEDVRSFISAMAKQETSLLNIRKERTGTDMYGATYWYESDPIAGYRLYRELQRSNGKNKVKLEGHLVSAPAMGHWETVATNLDEFQSVVDRLCSSKNKTEVLLGNKINSDIVPDLINAEKRKQRVLKKQSREASLLNIDFNADSVAFSRPRRERKHVSYTYDDYDNSINEALDVMKGLYEYRAVEDPSSGQDIEEEDNMGREGHGSAVHTRDIPTHFSKSDFCSNEHSSRHGRKTQNDNSLPECNSNTSSGCNNIEERVDCIDELLHKRQRAGSLDASDPQSNESKDMSSAGVCSLKEEDVPSEIDLKATALNGNQESLKRNTRIKVEKHEN